MHDNNVYYVLGLGFEAQVLGLDLGLGLCVLDSNTDNTTILVYRRSKRSTSPNTGIVLTCAGFDGKVCK